MLIRLTNAFTNYEEGVDKIISLYFMSDNGYEKAYEYFNREILNRNLLNEFSKRDCKYDIYSANKIGVHYINLKFINDCDRKNFWNWHILVYGDQDNSNKRIYLDIPGYECDIRGVKIPLLWEYRFEKYDKVLNAKAIFIDDKEREEKKNMYLEVIGGRRNGKETAKELLNLIYGTSQMTNDLIPAMIRSVQINEKKRVVTIVWKDGTVTMAKCSMFEQFDVEKGISIAVMKRFFSSTTKMNKWLKEQTKDYYERTVENGFEDEDRLSLKDLVENYIKNA